MRLALLSLFLLLFVTAFVGSLPLKRSAPCVHIDVLARSASTRLFVLVPGIRGVGPFTEYDGLEHVGRLLSPHGAVVRVSYANRTWSNADPSEVTREMASAIAQYWAKTGRPEIVLVGHSSGALLTRRAFLEPAAASWRPSVQRVVLLAGMNRGWDISGQKPADMGIGTYLWLAIGSWAGRMAGAGRLVLDLESGSPFVANLRLDWLTNKGSVPETVQLLGDIDDLVSEDDNKDIAVVGSDRFAWLRVRGTGHKSITKVAPPGPDSKRYDGIDLLEGDELRNALMRYRGEKVLLAATAKTFEAIQAAAERHTLDTDTTTTHLAFVLHGIRDLGEWSSVLEQELNESFVEAHGAPASEPLQRLRVVAPRYGYFGMGPFVFQIARQKYVRWFMDSYTEALAKHPNAMTNTSFFGHSNGTYLLADAIKEYDSLQIGNVALAGSVIRHEYDWCAPIKAGRVRAVRNFVASDDLVVALFPGAWERPPLSWLGNRIGSAGFNGLKDGAPLPGRTYERTPACPASADGPQDPVENAGLFNGGHAAFLRHGRDIARFLISDDAHTAPAPTRVDAPAGWFLKVFSDWGAWLVWLAMAAAIAWLGARVTIAGQENGWIALTGYVVLLVWLLRNI